MSNESGGEGRALTTRTPTPVEHLQPIFDTGRFEHMQRAARALSHSTLLPQSVRGSSAEECFSNLMVIFDFAERWKQPPVMLAQCVSIVHNKLMFEGKAIAAALETTLGVKLDYEWTDHEPGHPDFGIRVFGTRPGETEPREVRGTVGGWRTYQKDGRTPNPAWSGAASKMQLAYRGAREWARLWAPGTMLGVYGDDEVDAWDDRRAVREEAPRVTSGFAPPKVDPDGEDGDIQDAEVEDIDADAKPAQEAAGAAPASGKATPPDKATKPASDSPAPGAKAKPKGGKDQAPAETDEERAERLFQDGHTAGLAGEECAPPTGLKKAEDLENWTLGHHAGAAERMEDAGEDASGEESDGEAETFTGDEAAAGEMSAETQAQLRDAAETFVQEMGADPDPFEAFFTGVRKLNSWADIKAGLSALSRSDAWTAAMSEAGAPRVRQARISAWLRTEELRKAGKESVDVINDLTAFRCWAETTEDPDAIAGNWRVLVDQPVYTALAPEQKRKLEAAMMKRMKELREPPLDRSLA